MKFDKYSPGCNIVFSANDISCFAVKQNFGTSPPLSKSPCGKFLATGLSLIIKKQQ